MTRCTSSGSLPRTRKTRRSRLSASSAMASTRTTGCSARRSAPRASCDRCATLTCMSASPDRSSRPAISPDESERFNATRSGWVKFEPYPAGYKGSATGRFWTQAQIDSIGKGCGTVRRPCRAQDRGDIRAVSRATTAPRSAAAAAPTSRSAVDGEFVWDGTYRASRHVDGRAGLHPRERCRARCGA
jgi:hypothetical protein